MNVQELELKIAEAEETQKLVEMRFPGNPIPIHIRNVPESTLIDYCEKTKINLHKPAIDLPYYWCLHEGDIATVHIHGPRKDVKLVIQD